MFNIPELLSNAINGFLTTIFQGIIETFGMILANIIGTSANVLQMPFVQSGIKYTQALAFSLLVMKAMNEAFQTHILRTNGDPDADPGNLIIRTGQATAVIAVMPWIVEQIFIFGTKVANDISHLNSGSTNVTTWIDLIKGNMEGSFILIMSGLIIVISVLVIAVQAAIRGAELALMSVIGPIMALNLTSSNRNVWGSWFKQILIICVSQALQIFMLQGAITVITISNLSGTGLLMIFAWLWVTIKTPKFLQQFAYTTGFSGAVGGTARQAGSMALMKIMLKS